VPEHSPRIAVHGRSRLIVDIIQGVLAEHEPNGFRPVSVLVDPDPEHWVAANGSAIVVVTTDESVDPVAAIRRGADAVIDADEVVVQLPDVVSIVERGGAVLTPEQARLLVDLVRNGHPEGVRLTRREIDIMRSIIEGDSVKQTAKRLGIAQKTVENLQSRLFKKLDVRNRAQAVARVHELDLLPDADTPPPSGGLHP
jgi:DNA-binding NarL/FixJ family response regulator